MASETIEPDPGNTALVVFEVRGLIDTVRVVDAAFKAAAVTHVRSLRVGGGRVAIWIEGTLTEVNSADDAGYAALESGREARSCTFSMPSPEVRAFAQAQVAA